jgi:hypothetical protein
MTITNVGETLTSLFRQLRWNRAAREGRNSETEYLVEAVVDYVRMRLGLNPDARVLVDVDELSFRFREDREVIRNVLRCLESQRRAQKTELDGVWKLHV